MSENKSAMVVREADASALAMVMEPSEAVERLRELQAFVRDVMVEGEDFGVLPGTKPTTDAQGRTVPPKKILLQPGAQKLAEIYGIAVVYSDERAPIEKWDEADPLFAYFKRATVTRRKDGLFLGSGLGSCNSREKKYASRWVFERDVPSHLDKSRLPMKNGIGKNNRPFTQYKVPNPEIFDLVNTIEKMACKRALVHAVIAVTRSSGLFTQDLEDMGSGGGGYSNRGETRDDVHEGEIIEEPPPAAPHSPPKPSASDLMHRLDGAGRDAAREVIRMAATMPKVRANAWKRLIEMAADEQEVSAIVHETDADGLPEDVRQKLRDIAADTVVRLNSAEPGDTAGAAA